MIYSTKLFSNIVKELTSMHGCMYNSVLFIEIKKLHVHITKSHQLRNICLIKILWMRKLFYPERENMDIIAHCTSMGNKNTLTVEFINL